jgi:hypothetical protein
VGELCASWLAPNRVAVSVPGHARPGIGHDDTQRLSDDLSVDRDLCPFLQRAHRILDRVFDQRLEQQRRHLGVAGGVLDMEFGLQPFLETHAFDAEVELERLDFWATVTARSAR